MMTVRVRYYTDPACIWSWGAEPWLRRLAWEFDGELEVRLVLGGLARSYGPAYRDSDGRIGSGPDCFADLMAHWLDVTSKTGMPSDPRLWTEARITSTYPVCMATIAAREQGPDAALAFIRRAREALICERRKLDHRDALVAQAGAAGLDVERFEIDLSSNAIVEAFGADLDEVRDVPDEARAAGAVKVTEGRERVSFPSLAFLGADGARAGVWGPRSYEAIREAAIATGASPTGRLPATALAVIERFGRVATREVEELTGRPRPLVEAELWALASEWRIRPVAVLTGTLWELA